MQIGLNPLDSRLFSPRSAAIFRQSLGTKTSLCREYNQPRFNLSVCVSASVMSACSDTSSTVKLHFSVFILASAIFVGFSLSSSRWFGSFLRATSPQERWDHIQYLHTATVVWPFLDKLQHLQVPASPCHPAKLTENTSQQQHYVWIPITFHF